MSDVEVLRHNRYVILNLQPFCNELVQTIEKAKGLSGGLTDWSLHDSTASSADCPDFEITLYLSRQEQVQLSREQQSEILLQVNMYCKSTTYLVEKARYALLIGTHAIYNGICCQR